MSSSYNTNNDYHSHIKNLERMTSVIDGPRFPNMFNRKPLQVAPPSQPAENSTPSKTIEGPNYHTHILKLEKKISTYRGPRFPNLFGNRKAAANLTKGVDEEVEAYIARKRQDMEDPNKAVAMKA